MPKSKPKFDAEDTKINLRAGRIRLTTKLIEGLHNGGGRDFLKEFYLARYERWLAKQPSAHVEDVGDRHDHHPAGPSPGHPDFVEVDKRIAANTR